MKKLLFGLLVLCILSSCKTNPKKTEAEQIINEWLGREIKIPDDYQCNLMGKDIDSTVCRSLFQMEYKIILYVDSAGCSTCRLKLLELKQLMKESDSLFYGRLGFLLFFQPKDSKEMYFNLKRNIFDYPVFIDKNNTINKLNHFPNNPEYQCFLLDKDNKVLSVGNPTFTPGVWKLYKKIITGKNYDEPPVTAAEPEVQEIELTDLHTGKTSEAVFKIKNTGTQPLIIHLVESSCGCTVPQWNKQPVVSGKSTEIRVKITPEKAEYFNKTVTVHCNVETGQILLKVKGTVEN